MSSDPQPHAPRPDRPPAEHRRPEHWEHKPDPFTSEGAHNSIQGTGQPEESGPGDRWTAIKSGVLFLLGGALVTWIIITLALG